MSLDVRYFEKNREFVTQTANNIETAIIRVYGDIANCPEDVLKESTEAAGRSFGSTLFKYLKIKRDAQKTSESNI